MHDTARLIEYMVPGPMLLLPPKPWVPTIHYSASTPPGPHRRIIGISLDGRLHAGYEDIAIAGFYESIPNAGTWIPRPWEELWVRQQHGARLEVTEESFGVRVTLWRTEEDDGDVRA